MAPVHCFGALLKAGGGGGVHLPRPASVLLVHGNGLVVDYDLAEPLLGAAVGPLGGLAGIEGDAGAFVVLQVRVQAVVAHRQSVGGAAGVGHLEGDALSQIAVVVQLLFLEGLRQGVGEHHRVGMGDIAVVPVVAVAVIGAGVVMLADIGAVQRHIEVVIAAEGGIVVVVVAQHQAGVHALRVYTPSSVEVKNVRDTIWRMLLRPWLWPHQ